MAKKRVYEPALQVDDGRFGIGVCRRWHPRHRAFARKLGRSWGLRRRWPKIDLAGARLGEGGSCLKAQAEGASNPFRTSGAGSLQPH